MHPLFVEPLRFEEGRVWVLTIEHPGLFRRMAEELILQSEGGEGAFVLSLEFEPLDCAERLLVVSDLFHLEWKERKLLNRLQQMVRRIDGERLQESAAKLTLALRSYLAELAQQLDYPVVYDEAVDLTALRKAAGFGLAIEGEETLERLLSYLSTYSGLMERSCFVLIGAKTLFGEEELRELYRMAAYRKWDLLLLERVALPPVEGEAHCLLDGDLCVLSNTQAQDALL